MFEVFLMMLAVSIQSVHPPSAGGTAVAVEKAAVAAQEQAQTPAAVGDDKAPEEPQEEAFAAPIFLAPGPQGPAAEAPPAFLAPAEPALKAEPQVPTGRFTTAVEVKPIMDATRANWVAVREYDGKDWVYVTQVWSWRCGLLGMKVGINGAPPEPWPLPPCHEEYSTPNAVLDGDGVPARTFPAGSVQSVEVQLTFDDLSSDGARFDRRSVLIP